MVAAVREVHFKKSIGTGYKRELEAGGEMTLASEAEPIQAAPVVLDLEIEELERLNASALGASPVTGDKAAMIGLAIIYFLL
jgi:hypothetical protein